MAGWQEFAKLAPLGTALIAVSAAIIALFSLRAQKTIARRRAAIDFFLKTDMDAKMIEVADAYDTAVAKFAKMADINEFTNWPEYWTIITYLNVHELLAIGIRRKVFDEGVCYGYWNTELKQTCAKLARLIEHQHSSHDEPYTFKQMIALNQRWCSRHQFWQRWRD